MVGSSKRTFFGERLGYVMNNLPLSVCEPHFAPLLKCFSKHLFASVEAQQSWHETCQRLWPQMLAPDVQQLLWETRALANADSLWRVMDRSDGQAALTFIEVSTRRLLPGGMRWSVARPEEVLDVETLFIEANRQLRSSGQQFYQCPLANGMLVSILVVDDADFTALAQRLGLSHGRFDAGVPIHADHEGGYGIKQILFWVMYVLLVLWGVYHLGHWLFVWLWHWFD